MDLIKNLLAEKQGELVNALMNKAGFGADQARAFVPEAADAVVEAAGGGSGLDPAALADAGPAELIGKIDVASLAARVGVDPGMATAGLSAIVPQLLEAFRGKLGALGGVASQLGEAGALGGAAKSLGGLLKR